MEPDSAPDTYRDAQRRLQASALELIGTCILRSGLSQAQIAERLGVSRPSISVVLNGRGNMQIGTLARLLWATGAEAEIRLMLPAEDDETTTISEGDAE